MTQKGNLATVCVLVLLLELTSLAPGQQCSSTYQPIPGQPGRDGRDGNDGSPGSNGNDGTPGRDGNDGSAGSNGNHGTPGIDGRDGSPAVFTHEDFLKLKQMLINEGVYCSQNSSTPSPSTTVTQTVTTTQVVHSTATCPTPTPSPVPTVTEYLTMNQTITTTQAVHSTATCPTPTPEVQRDCQEFNSNGFNQSGVYTIQPDSLPPFDVYCDMDTDGGGWTVYQRRQDGSVDFYRNWDNYTAGFGNLSGEFWLGLDKISRLTNASSSELRVDLGDFDNQTRYAQYSSFQVDDASTNYTLTVSGYSGTAVDSLTHHSGRQFTTYDRDNDIWSHNCAMSYKGAWWYTQCAHANLNGQYLGGPVSSARGVHWATWRGHFYSLKFSEMKVRRSN